VSLRTKLVLALVALSALATVAVGTATYRSTDRVLRSEVDRSLEAATDQLAQRLDRRPGRLPPARPRAAGDVVFQALGPRGTVVSVDGVDWPVTAADRAAAVATVPVAAFRDDEVGGEPVRILTRSDGSGRGAVQAARSLAEVDRVLAEQGRRTVLAVMAVGVLAALAGALVARQVTRRLARLTAAAESVAATGDLTVGVGITGGDETGRLAAAFDGMLAALARSRDEQRRLVQDAGHELRTPLTSLRTNVYALGRADELDEEQRRRLVEDLRSETDELSALVDEVVELATDRRGDEPVTVVALGSLVEGVARRARRRTGREVVVTGVAGSVEGRPGALERAVANLVDNACKFDDSGGPIEVTVDGGDVWVADRGPGIPPADVPLVFDRFHRAAAARALPGSGLGLAIVRDVVEAHGGTVAAGNRPGGGAVVGFRLPAVTPPGPPSFSPGSHPQPTAGQPPPPKV
jgi:two-component system sensor histidine kinase MprB